MKIDIITLFPEMFEGVFEKSILGRAQKEKLVEIKMHNLRKWAKDRHKTVDSPPYGGGAGMVMKVDVVDRAIKSLKRTGGEVILLTPQGKPFKQEAAQKLANMKHLILICGHYEGFDERIRKLVDEEISIGDYILTGGEIPAMVVVDSVVRLLPGVVGNQKSVKDESFSGSGLEYPQYTKPREHKGEAVPEVLLSGNHAEIDKWRKKEAINKTRKIRPDLA